MTALKKVLIAASEGPIRVGLVHILEADPGITVVCEAGDGDEVLDRAVELRPHVILIDVPLIRDDAFEAVLRIRDAVPATSIILMSDSQAQEDISRALACGALGYLLRSSPGVEIIQAVKAAASGKVVLSPGIAAVLAARLGDRAKEPRLSRRETEILKLLGEGLSNREIAGRLTINTSTVKTYIYRILDKLNLRNRREATAYAAHLYASYARFGSERGQIITDIIAPKQIEHLRTPGAEDTPGQVGEPVSAAGPAESAAEISGGAIIGERKQATALSMGLDLRSDASSQVESESAGRIGQECLETLAEVVRRFGGRPAWIGAHSLTALFGVPVSLEHAPHKALSAALAVREQVLKCNERHQNTGIRINARVGINTGTLLMVKTAHTSEASYIPVADTVRLAEKLRSIAETGSILVSESTYHLTRDQYSFEGIGVVGTKTADEKVQIYRLLTQRKVESKLYAAAMRGLSSFVGRQKEIETLRAAFEEAKAGKGQVIGIVGEAGIGKSRLVLEIRQELPMEEYRYLEGGCISYNGAAPYLPLLDILKAYFDIKEGESESDIKENMQTALSRLDERLTGICPVLSDALSLEVDDPEYLSLELPQRKEKLFEAVRDLLISESQKRPLVIAIEDLHWVDSSTEEFLSYFMGWMAHTHIMLILLYRPEFVHAWASRSCYSQIRVNELNEENSAEMMRSILGDGEVAPEVLAIVAGRAGGNPLFIEELTRDLRENGAILKKGGQHVLDRAFLEMKVPGSIEGIIAARMDRLEGSLKHTLQVASVIGRDFNYRVLQAVTGMHDELKSSLLDLQRCNFIYEKSLFPDMEYIFKHALIRETAYGSLLLKQRKEIHERVGRAMEELYPDRLEEIYEELAHQFHRSDNLEKAYQYLRLSGDKTTGQYSNSAAFHFYREAISTLKTMPDTVENRRRTIEVLLLMEGPMKLLAYPEGSLEILQDGERLAAELGDERALAIIYASMGLCYTFRGDSSQGIKYSEYCFEMAKSIEDIELMAPIAFDLCSSYTIMGDFTKTTKVAPKVLALLEKSGRQTESFGVAFNFNVYSALSSYYGQAMGFLGYFQEGEALCEKGLRFAEQIDNVYSVAFAQMMYGLLLFVKGDGKRAVDHLNHALRCGEEGEIIPVIGVAQSCLGCAYLLLGDLKKARSHAERGLEVQREAGLHMLMSLHIVALGMIHFESGDVESARSCLEDALRSSRTNGEKWVEGRALICLGRVLTQADQAEYERAEEYLSQGIRHCQEKGLRPTCAQGHLHLGELYAKTGQIEKAIKCLKQAESMFRDMGMDYWLPKTQEELQRLGS